MTESKDAVNGSDVTLTIDHDVQWYVEKVLKESCAKYSSPWGVAVVQDTQTGTFSRSPIATKSKPAATRRK